MMTRFEVNSKNQGMMVDINYQLDTLGGKVLGTPVKDYLGSIGCW